MTRTDFIRQYGNLWPEIANAALLVELYRSMGAAEPERMAITGYVTEKDVEKGIALLQKIEKQAVTH